MRQYIKIVEAAWDEDDEDDIPKLDEQVLPEGTTLFHSTNGDFDESSTRLYSPAWFSDNPHATDFFKDWHGEQGGQKRVIEYHLNQAVRLLVIHSKQTLSDLNEYYGIETGDTESLAEGICNMGYDGWIIPTNYASGPDIMLCKSGSVDYVNTVID